MTSFAIATQILQDGPRNTTAKVTGDVATLPTAVTILDPALLTDMNPGMSGTHLATLLRVDEIQYSITDGVIVQLLWDATTFVPIVELYGRGTIKAKDFGGLQNNAGAGVTGKILLSALASGAASPTDSSILLILNTVKFRPLSVGGA